MQLQFDYAHNDRHPGGYLYRDRERGIGHSYENNHSAIYGGVKKLTAPVSARRLRFRQPRLRLAAAPSR